MSNELHKFINTLRPRQGRCHFTDNVFKYVFLNENFWISNKISLKYVPWGIIDNMAALVQVMAWYTASNKPLSEPVMLYLTDAYMRHSAEVI